MNALIGPMCDALAALARQRDAEAPLRDLRPLLAAYLQLHEDERDLAFAIRKLDGLIAKAADRESLRAYMGVLLAEMLVAEHCADWSASPQPDVLRR